MTSIRKQELLLAGSCCAGLIAAWRSLGTVEVSAFLGGRITGPVFTTVEIGIIFFLLALLVTFWYLRISATVTLTASLLGLPLYFYLTTPGPFRWIFRREYSVPLQASFLWHKWAAAGMFAIAIAA